MGAFYPTYEELKFPSDAMYAIREAAFYPTYEELKFVKKHYCSYDRYTFYPTYEELKCLGWRLHLRPCILFILPMKN